MQAVIPCELYSRLATIPQLIDAADDRNYLRSLFIERHNNKLFAVVTSVKIAVIEFVANDVGPNESTAIKIDEALISQCDKETSFNSALSIVANPLLQYTSIKTTFGFNHLPNAWVDLPETHSFRNWRKWFPNEIPKKSKGGMRWNTPNVVALATASKSGILLFPEHIDASLPVVIADEESNDWFGLFMPNKPDNVANGPVELPDWLI